MSNYEPGVKANDAYNMAFKAYRDNHGDPQLELQAVAAMASAAHALAVAEHTAMLSESQQG